MTTAHPRPQTAARAVLRLNAPFISVIVPVRNEEAFIESTLRQLLTQDYDPERFDVLVADGRSTDLPRETFDACEDVEFNHRLAAAGLRCFFTPRARVRYFPRATLKALFLQMARYGRGRVRLLRKHPDTFSLTGFLPALFVAGVFLGPLL